MTHGIIIKVSVFKDKIIFSIPAGKREIGETAWEAAVRETKEEVVIDIESSIIMVGRAPFQTKSEWWRWGIICDVIQPRPGCT